MLPIEKSCLWLEGCYVSISRWSNSSRSKRGGHGGENWRRIRVCLQWGENQLRFLQLRRLRITPCQSNHCHQHRRQQKRSQSDSNSTGSRGCSRPTTGVPLLWNSSVRASHVDVSLRNNEHTNYSETPYLRFRKAARANIGGAQ